MVAETEWRLPPLGLYIHLPWCVHKCPYCDFNSHPLRGDLPSGEYVDRLIEDLEEELPYTAGRTIDSVFIGGGTPSLFSGQEIGRILEGVGQQIEHAPDAEITLEANPGTIERDTFKAYAQAGVNRVSLGVQSFDDSALRKLGRIHDARAAHQALESLHEAGIKNFNIDLMYGLPGQDAEGAMQDLETALAARPTHISHYQLTLEPNTAFAYDPPTLPCEEVCWEMYSSVVDRLGAQGLQNYEISAWAQPGSACRHNLNYWRYGDFIGIGAGAHGKLTQAEGRVISRTRRPRQPRVYLSALEPTRRMQLQNPDKVFEFFLNRLRLREGFKISDFEARTGLDFECVEKRVQDAMSRGLLERSGHSFVTTNLGWRFINDIQALFLPKAQPAWLAKPGPAR